MKTLEQTLAEKSIKQGECRIWIGSKHKQGYGLINRARKGKRQTVMAHRAAYELAYGEIPAGLKICHRCDTPACIEPAHLFPGTQADNLADMKSKGRDNRGLGGRPFRFSREERAAAVADPRPRQVVAAELGVRVSTLYR